MRRIVVAKLAAAGADLVQGAHDLEVEAAGIDLADAASDAGKPRCLRTWVSRSATLSARRRGA
jgi:hypothetical protein